MTTPKQIQRAYREAAQKYLRGYMEPFPVWDEAVVDALADHIVDAYKVALVDPNMADLRGEGSACVSSRNSAT